MFKVFIKLVHFPKLEAELLSVHLFFSSKYISNACKVYFGGEGGYLSRNFG